VSGPRVRSNPSATAQAPLRTSAWRRARQFERQPRVGCRALRGGRRADRIPRRCPRARGARGTGVIAFRGERMKALASPAACSRSSRCCALCASANAAACTYSEGAVTARARQLIGALGVSARTSTSVVPSRSCEPCGRRVGQIDEGLATNGPRSLIRTTTLLPCEDWLTRA